mgnify:CR=1 FL=1
MRNYISIFSRHIYNYYSFRDKELASVAPWLIPSVLVWFNYMTISSALSLISNDFDDIDKNTDYLALVIIVVFFYYFFGYKRVHLKHNLDYKLVPWFALYAIVTLITVVLSATLVREKIVMGNVPL